MVPCTGSSGVLATATASWRSLDYYRLHLPDFPELNPSASYRNYILNIFEYDVWTLILPFISSNLHCAPTVRQHALQKGHKRGRTSPTWLWIIRPLFAIGRSGFLSSSTILDSDIAQGDIPDGISLHSGHDDAGQESESSAITLLMEISRAVDTSVRPLWVPGCGTL